ncbi:MAG: ImmA/IrrE family metallo-endopeptidase [bacterium]|nr:ImmA/IrrE family metallo-endopeptidase [bacterium]
MSLQDLSQNVRRYRLAKGMSQPVLAEAAGISLPAVKNLEGAKSVPRVRTVEAIAHALGVPLRDLFLPVRKLQTVRFRSAKKMQNRENILADAARWLDEYNYLEGLLDDKLEYRLGNIQSSRTDKGIIKVAKKCRAELGLDKNEPIYDICGLLESGGIKVYPVKSSSDGFFGLSISAHDGGPAVVVNTWERIQIERQVFSAAHELGHLVLHKDAFDVERIDENEDEEKQAHLFASHFLMADEAFVKEWNEAAGLHWIDRVIKVKRIFRVSYGTVLFRLIDHRVADESIWLKFKYDFKQKFGISISNKTEPMPLQHGDFFEDRFSRLIRQALEEEKISLSRGAELLRITIEDMHDLTRNWEAIL